MLQITLREDHKSIPLHRQIADQIRFQIEHGEVGRDTRLPSSRDLARQLGVARGTVVYAYEELCAAGLCQSRVGCGTVVTHVNGLKKRYESPRAFGNDTEQALLRSK